MSGWVCKREDIVRSVFYVLRHRSSVAGLTKDEYIKKEPMAEQLYVTSLGVGFGFGLGN